MPLEKCALLFVEYGYPSITRPLKTVEVQMRLKSLRAKRQTILTRPLACVTGLTRVFDEYIYSFMLHEHFLFRDMPRKTQANGLTTLTDSLVLF